MKKSSFKPLLKLKKQEFEPLFPAIANKIAHNKLEAELIKTTPQLAEINEDDAVEVEVVGDKIEKAVHLTKYSPEWWAERRSATKNNEN